jgi:hypothetical protein
LKLIGESLEQLSDKFFSFLPERLGSFCIERVPRTSSVIDSTLTEERIACSAVAESFIFGFRLIMLLCAGLATASAAVAWRKIPAESAARVPDFGDVAAAEESRW